MKKQTAGIHHITAIAGDMPKKTSIFTQAF